MTPAGTGGGTGAHLRSVLPVAAIVVLVACVYSYHQETVRLSDRAQALEARAEAHALRGRLVGQRLGDLKLERVRGGDRAIDLESPAGGLRVLWFVDPRRCVSCLKDPSGWRNLNGKSSVLGTVILTGVDQARAAKVSRAVNLDGEILRDRGEWSQIAARIGEDPPPYVLLLLGRNGEVLAAEVGDRWTNCEPDVFRRLTALVEALEDGSNTGGRQVGSILASRRVHSPETTTTEAENGQVHP